MIIVLVSWIAGQLPPQHQSSSSVSGSLTLLVPAIATLLGLVPTLGTVTGTPGWLSLPAVKLSCLSLLPAVTAELPLSLPGAARYPCLAGLGGAVRNEKVEGIIPGGQKFDCMARLGLGLRRGKLVGI